MVEVKYIGRLGNHLFTYASARVLAEQLGYCLQAPAIPGFPGTEDAVPGRMYYSPQQTLAYDQFFDAPALVADKRARKILVQAYCQNYAYFREHAAAVRRWYQQPEPATQPDPEAVVCHLRLTDFVDYRWSISLDYYRTVLATLYRGRPVVLVTDDPDHVCLKEFIDRGAMVHRGETVLDDFRMLVAARHLLIGTSTFAWWAAFLSTGRVVAPLPARGYYFRPEYKNEHYLVDEDRYTYVTGVKMFHE